VTKLHDEIAGVKSVIQSVETRYATAT